MLCVAISKELHFQTCCDLTGEVRLEEVQHSSIHVMVNVGFERGAQAAAPCGCKLPVASRVVMFILQLCLENTRSYYVKRYLGCAAIMQSM